MKKVYFKLGAFLMPTFCINSIQINRHDILKKLRFNKKKILLVNKIKTMIKNNDHLEFQSVNSEEGGDNSSSESDDESIS